MAVWIFFAIISYKEKTLGFCKIRWHNEIKSNSEVYSSFASIYINPVIN